MNVLEGTVTVENVDDFVETIAEIEHDHDTDIQVFDARYVAGREHIERAVELATRAHQRDEGIARKLSVEILLYAAGRRQINQALEMGVSEGDNDVVCVVVGGDEDGATTALEGYLEPRQTLGSDNVDSLRDFFEISDEELAATDGNLDGIICERSALLVVEQ